MTSVTPSTRLRFAMRILLKTAWLLLIVPGCVLGQRAAQTDSSAAASEVAAEVKALREALLQTQQQVAAQQHEIEILKSQSKTDQPGVVNASFTAAPAQPSSSVIVPRSESSTAQPQSQQPPEDSAPTSIRVGDAVLT